MFPLPRQVVQGRCEALLPYCFPCPRQTEQVMDPFPLHSGHLIAADFSAMFIHLFLFLA
jgi:hypothetical protein